MARDKGLYLGHWNAPANRFYAAICALAPGSVVSFEKTDEEGGGTILEWHETDPPVVQPSDAAIKAKVAELKVEWDKLEYSRERKIDYDDLNQDEMRADDELNGTTTWLDALAEIKARWPKDNSGPIE